MVYPNIFPMSYRNFETRRTFYRSDFGRSHKWKYPKNRFFQNHLKYVLDALEWWFLVQNTSKTLQKVISGHISSFRSISASLSNIEFLAKIDFFAKFWIFDVSQYGPLFGRKWPKICLVARNGFFVPQNTSTYHVWYLMTIRTQFRSHQKSWFFAIFSL